MLKEYCYSYKVSSLPYWYTFKCYADCAAQAQKAFEKAYPAAVGDEMVLSAEQAEETETECDYCGSIAELFPIADIN